MNIARRGKGGLMQSNIPQFELAPGYFISRILKGGWQLAADHNNANRISPIEDMFAFVDAGITTFDCGDIYTGVEELIGEFRIQYQKRFGKVALEKIHVHTKFVPDRSILPTIDKSHVTSIIDRSLKRLGMERLDMVQFHFWDFAIPRYVETAVYLQELQKAGKIRFLSVTNFDVKHLQELIDTGVQITSHQVQYSLLDNRPEHGMVEFCQRNNIKLLCYGTVAGGFLSEKYLGVAEPLYPLENRSLTKYKLILDDFGGWNIFQELLQVLKIIADKHGVSITNVATKYILDKSQVAGAIIGARNTNHLADNIKTFGFTLDANDHDLINQILLQAKELLGDIYELERIKGGKHAGIMKYNLNKEE